MLDLNKSKQCYYKTMEDLPDFITHSDGAKVLMLYHHSADLQRALETIADHWMTFEMTEHRLYKIADDKEQGWQESVRIETRRFGFPGDKMDDYDQVIMINPEITSDFNVVQNCEWRDDKRRFILILEATSILRYLRSPGCNLVLLYLALECVRPGGRKGRSYIIRDRDGDESDSQ